MSTPREPADVLYRVKRGLSGYVSYLAACEMNQSFSEYILYEPMLRILTARGFRVSCEAPCPGVPRMARGDVKRLDFVAQGHGIHFAIEVKWARNNRPAIGGDIEKLRCFRIAEGGALAFLCIFGRKSSLAELSLGDVGLREQGAAVFAEFGVTKYGCRIYEVVAGVRSGMLSP